jgi:citrate/tricarballylate utilization protein
MRPEPEAASLFALVEEAQRELAICNACRYCEGYCAVFPALQRRLAFDERDVHYLANLCHNCGACLYACQYAPPHAFAVDFPRALAQVRKASYERYAWPAPLAAAFQRNGVVVAIVTMLSLAMLMLFTVWYAGAARLFTAFADEQGAFYAILPHGVMTAMFGSVFAFAVLALAMSAVRFWRDMGESASAPALADAVRDAATLRYLEGGGDGCTYPDDTPSPMRRIFHHLTFYGFLACFAATIVATIYHYAFGWKAPYGYASLPVVLGTLGGAGLLIGPVGLLVLMRRRDRELGDPRQRGMDAGFLVLLFATSLTGLLLLALRETRAMGALLVVHLASVMALFVTMPYGKFVHAIHRLVALVRFHVERRRPLPFIGAE